MKVGMIVKVRTIKLLVGIVGAVVPAVAAVRAPTVAAATVAMTAVMVVVMAMKVVVVVVVVGAGVIVAGVGATVLVHRSVGRRRSGRGSSRIALLPQLLGAVPQHARLLGRPFSADLLGPHAGVAAAELQQLLVRARLDNLAIVQAKDLIGVRDGGQAVPRMGKDQG